MDKQSQKRFDELVAREPAALTEADIFFLRARASYLNEDQKAKFADILGTAKPSKPSRKKADEE